MKEGCRDNEPYVCRHGFKIHADLYSNAPKNKLKKTHCEEGMNKINCYKSNGGVKNDRETE